MMRVGRIAVLLTVAAAAVVVVAADFQKEPQVIITHPGKYESFEAMAGTAPLLIGDNGQIDRVVINVGGFAPAEAGPDCSIREVSSGLLTWTRHGTIRVWSSNPGPS